MIQTKTNKVTAQSLVNLLCHKWDLKLYGDRRNAQVKIAQDLLKKYDPELVHYTLENSHLYVKAGQDIYSLNYLPYIIDRARDDYEKISLLPQKISEAKEKRKEDLSKINQVYQPLEINLNSREKELKKVTEKDLDDLFVL